MEAPLTAATSPDLKKDDLIVIAGAGGFIAGSLARYFHDQGFTNIRAIDKKPLPEWYQRVPGVESLCMDLSEDANCRAGLRGCGRGLQPGRGHGRHGLHRAIPRRVPAQHPDQHAHDRGRVPRRRTALSSSPRPPAPTTSPSSRIPTSGRSRSRTPIRRMAERGYGWEKLMSEMFCQEYWAERGLETHIARFHNVYGPYGTWDGGREKAPGGHLPQGDRGQGHRQQRDRDLGRRHADPQLHVSSTTASRAST